MDYGGYSGTRDDNPSLAVRLMQVAGEFELEKKRETQRFIDTIQELERDKSRLQQKTWDQSKEIDRLRKKLEEAYDLLNESKAQNNAASNEYSDGLKRELIALRFEYADRVNQLSRWRRARKAGKPILSDSLSSNTNAPIDQENAIPDAAVPLDQHADSEEMKAAALEAIAAGETKGDVYSREMLYIAAEEGLEEMVSSIVHPSPTALSRGFDETLGEAFRRACSRGHVSIARQLLSAGAAPNVRSTHDHSAQMPLHAAAAAGSDVLVRLLTSLDATDVNDRDAYLRTPLHYAAASGAASIVKFLLLNGANCDMADESGATPMEAARTAAQSSAIEVLEDPHVMFWNSSVRANKLYNDKNFQGAIDMYSRALELAPKCSMSTSPRDLATLHYNRARAAYRLGKHIRAIEDCTTALEHDATYRNALAQRAECHMSLFDFGKAASDFEALLKSMPSDKQWVRRLDDACAMRDMTHYQVLALSRGASSSQIKKAYRQQCLKWHPDKHSRSEEDSQRSHVAFNAIAVAYETLSDDHKRRMYDLEISIRRVEPRRSADGFDRWYSKELSREAERAKERDAALRKEKEKEESLLVFLREERQKAKQAAEAKERRNARQAKMMKKAKESRISPRKSPKPASSPLSPPVRRRVTASPVNTEEGRSTAAPARPEAAPASQDAGDGDTEGSSTPTADIASTGSATPPGSEEASQHMPEPREEKAEAPRKKQTQAQHARQGKQAEEREGAATAKRLSPKSLRSRDLAASMKERLAAQKEHIRHLEARAKAAVAAGEAARGSGASLFDGDPDAEELGLTGMSFSDLEADNDEEGEALAARLRATLDRAAQQHSRRRRRRQQPQEQGRQARNGGSDASDGSDSVDYFDEEVFGDDGGHRSGNSEFNDAEEAAVEAVAAAMRAEAAVNAAYRNPGYAEVDLQDEFDGGDGFYAYSDDEDDDAEYAYGEAQPGDDMDDLFEEEKDLEEYLRGVTQMGSPASKPFAAGAAAADN